ncbi:MAG TPA: NADH-quinone oxidoreductase subunit L [Candidatus Hypogeohydataceae bacterium YC41]
MVEATGLFNKLWLVPAIPLGGALFNCLLGRRVSNLVVSIVSCGSIGLAGVMSLLLFNALLKLPPAERHIELSVYNWIFSGDFRVPIDLLLDPLSMAMITMVSWVSFLIHVYSVGYMRKDESFARYFCYLNLFVFFMLLLVLAGNFLVLYIGWEGVGLCSYLLISFWYERHSAASAGLKAFVVTRFGDFFFALGIMLVFVQFKSLYFGEVFPRAHEVLTPAMATWIALLIFGGAIGKSAQVPLHTWLPDAMEAPTPVSALIHAATMVTAGVYLVARCYPIFQLTPTALCIVAIVGLLTAFISASIALVHNDIKRILAYSTVSQLGHMFLGLGVGAPTAAIFHLLTHAFAKALLFLGSGAVIQALHEEMDIRRMGALKGYIPSTCWTFLIGALAMAGIPGFAGFFSKDAILHATFVNGGMLSWLIMIVTASFTAFYCFRLFFNTFFGEKRWDSHVEHVEHPTQVMTIPLILLAGLAAFGGYMGVPHALGGADKISSFLAPVFPPAHHTDGGSPSKALEIILMAVTSLVALGGIGLAYFFYIVPGGRETPGRLQQTLSGVYKFLSNGWYFDKVYQVVFVEPFLKAADFFWQAVDNSVIDMAVRGLAGFILRCGEVVPKLQLGLVRWYALSMVVGAVIIGYFYLR